MAEPYDSTTSAIDLAAVALGGQLNESVMQALFDISSIPLPLTDRIGVGSHDNPIHEWTMDRLADPAVNVVAEGAEDVGVTTVNGIRVRNYSQISATRVKVSQRTQNVNAIGFANKLADSITRRGNEVRRDVEYSMLGNTASEADDGAGDGAISAGLEAWIEPKDIRGTATSSVVGEQSAGTITGGGWSNQSGGIVPAWTYQAATVVPDQLQLANLELIAQSVWELGGNPTLIMSRPKVIAALSKYMFSSTANIATLQSDQGVPREGLVAIGAVNVFLTNFGITLAMVPNRLQPYGDTAASTPDSTTLFVLDPSMLEISYLQGYQTSEIGKLGLTEAREISVDWTLVVKNFETCGMAQGIDEAKAVIA